MAMSKLSLSEAIESIRSELAAAQRQGERADLKFEVGEVELELEIVTELAATAGAEAKWFVVTGKTDAQYKESKKQKIKIKLKPIGVDGKSVEVSKTLSQNPQ
jgi:DsbC/DsbD-like thiol-disulfide interchange protein